MVVLWIDHVRIKFGAGAVHEALVAESCKFPHHRRNQRSGNVLLLLQTHPLLSHFVLFFLRDTRSTPKFPPFTITSV